MRKPAFRICETNGEDQLCGKRAADQRHRFCYTDKSHYFLDPQFEASGHLLCLYSPVCVGPGREHKYRFYRYVAHILRNTRCSNYGQT